MVSAYQFDYDLFIQMTRWLIDTRVFGQPVEYALCRVSTILEVLAWDR
jgi:hypothetical protein